MAIYITIANHILINIQIKTDQKRKEILILHATDGAPFVMSVIMLHLY